MIMIYYHIHRNQVVAQEDVDELLWVPVDQLQVNKMAKSSNYLVLKQCGIARV